MATTTTIPPSLLDFLRDLKENNDRDWFNAHKDRYKTQHAHFKTFAQALRDEMSHYDEVSDVNLFRIYRDVRFSKDKSPYKPHFSGYLRRVGRRQRGGYYFHIEPGGVFLGGGFWDPEKEDLKRIRQDIAADDRPLRRIIADPAFQETFGEMRGDRLKSAPQGYAKDHPAIDLLRYKQFLLSRTFTDAEALKPSFLPAVTQTFVRMRPFLDYMSEVLTTDENGVPLE